MKSIAVITALAASLSVSAAVILTPGDLSYLNPVSGSGLGYVYWNGTTTFAASLSAFGDYGYVVEDATDTVVLPMVDIGGTTHNIVTTSLSENTWYYLATSDVVQSVGSSFGNAELQTESFILVPEPGTYALLAGLGLVGFAGIRRFRS